MVFTVSSRYSVPKHTVICFFEPHTYSRTQQTLSELSLAFNAADQVYIAEVYPAREQKLATSISGQEVVLAVAAQNPKVEYIADRVSALQKYKSEVRPGDVVVVMAVGSFNTLVDEFKKVYDKENK